MKTTGLAALGSYPNIVPPGQADPRFSAEDGEIVPIILVDEHGMRVQPPSPPMVKDDEPQE
jgi:hypothetical protein